MKEVAILLLVALMLNGCGSNSSGTSTGQVASTGGWLLETFGGVGAGSGFSFVTNFSVNSDSSLNIRNFQFLTAGTCFVSGETETGTLIQSVNGNGVVTGPFTFTITSGNPAGNVLTLSGTEDGNTITGNWTLTGTGDCPSTTGNQDTFTMTLTT
jgi:heat shock protein HslJ